MKHLVFGCGLAFGLAGGLAVSAQAAISVSVVGPRVPGTFDNNPVGAMTGFSRAIYDGAVGPIEFVAGADTTGVSNGTTVNVAATPAGNSSNYLWGLQAGTFVYFGSQANPRSVNSFLINWGSIDALSAGRYDNVLTLSNGLSITGSDLVTLGLAAGLGNQFNAADNKWFLIRSEEPFQWFRANSPQNAFEFDMAVPEPGTWALLIAGFGLVGLAARRRRGRVLAA
jgi:hypothetical protein